MIEAQRQRVMLVNEESELRRFTKQKPATQFLLIQVGHAEFAIVDGAAEIEREKQPLPKTPFEGQPGVQRTSVVGSIEVHAYMWPRRAYRVEQRAVKGREAHAGRQIDVAILFFTDKYASVVVRYSKPNFRNPKRRLTGHLVLRHEIILLRHSMGGCYLRRGPNGWCRGRASDSRCRSNRTGESRKRMTSAPRGSVSFAGCRLYRILDNGRHREPG